MNGYTATEKESTDVAEQPDETPEVDVDVDERTVRAIEEYLTVLPDAADGEDMVKVHPF